MSYSETSTICFGADTCMRSRRCHRSWARRFTRSVRTKWERSMAQRMRASFQMTSRRASWPRRRWDHFLSAEVWGIAATTNGSFSWGTCSRSLHPRGELVNLIAIARPILGTVLEDGDERKVEQEGLGLEEAIDAESVFRAQA